MTSNATRFPRPLPALACLALCVLSACASVSTPEPLYDYGLGDNRIPVDGPGATALATAAPLMDYGVALFEAPAPARVEAPKLASR